MKDRIEAILAEINGLACKTGKEVEEARVRLLGKKGEITRLFEEFRTVAPELKREFGKSLNELKTAAVSKIEALKSAAEEKADCDSVGQIVKCGGIFPILNRGKSPGNAQAQPEEPG